MPKKTIGFVQVNFRQGPEIYNAYYLPYSAGVVISYALSFPEISENWELRDLIWRREPIEQVAQKLATNDVVALSTYVWNRRYNYALGRRIKELNPNCLIIVGGPEPAVTDPKLFEKEPWMDVIILLEGEVTFKKLLEFPQSQYETIPGLLINTPGGAVNTGTAERISELDVIPSPYLTGVFDKIMAESPGVTWNATIETNRGCPYACTFCDWGSLTYNKVKNFSVERVYAELEWIGQNCGHVVITDANFGIFVERDNMIIDKLLEVQKKYGKITNFSLTWAKNQNDDVVKIVKKLLRESPRANGGLTVSVQSMDPDVLENIKRKNLKQHKIDEIFGLCDRESIPVYTELILGLPGETVKSWRDNFWKLFQAGNHYGVVVNHAALIENAEMNLLQRKLWKMDAVPIWDYISGTYKHDEVDECMDLVVGTRDIPRKEMIDLFVWNSFIQTFHINGLTTYLARYLSRQGVGYEEFYDKLYAYVNEDPWFKKEFQETKQYYEVWAETGRANHPKVGGLIDIPGWNLHNRTTINLHNERKIDYAYEVIERFMQQTYQSDQLSELLRFQRNSTLIFEHMKSLPIIEDFHYDFLGYIQDGSELNTPVRCTFSTVEDQNMEFQLFLESLWFGRKRNFTRLRIAKDPL